PCAPHAPLAPPAGNLRCPPELRSTHHGPGVVFDDLVTQSGSARLLEFRIRRDHSSDALVFADSPAVRIPRVWDILSLRGRPVIILGVPQTYPVSRVNGVMVSCFLTPDTERSHYTYPSEVKEEIEGLVGRYMVAVEGFGTEERSPPGPDRGDDREALPGCRAPSRDPAVGPLLMVEMGTDRIHHGFWRFLGPEHR